MQGWMMDTEDHIRTIVEGNSYQNLLIVLSLPLYYNNLIFVVNITSLLVRHFP